MKKYKAIIYDLDGTVLNTINMNMYPLIKIIKEETGEDWTFEQVLKFLPYPGMKVMEELQVADKEKAYARWVKYVNEYEEGASLYPGFEEIFEAFDGSIIQAVASAKTTAQYQIDFVAKGLDKYMKTAVLANDTVKHKPDPEPLLECLKRLSLQPEDVIYIVMLILIISHLKTLVSTLVMQNGEVFPLKVLINQITCLSSHLIY